MERITRLRRTSMSRDQSEIRHRNKKLLSPFSRQISRSRLKENEDSIDK